MPIKVGGSYVSEAAYNYAKAQTDEENSESGVLKSLADKFPNMKFSIGTGPFAGAGTNNVSISPKILKQMEKDPEKRMEYEALIYDIAHTDLAQGRNLKSAGWIIGDDGGLRAWSVSAGDTRDQSSVKRSEKKNWWRELLEKPHKKKSSPLKEAREKLLARNKEKAEKRLKDEKSAAVVVDISDSGQEALAIRQNDAAKISFADSNELSKHLFQSFDVVQNGMTKISAKYLRDCVDDDKKLQSLFDNLSAADSVLKERQGEIGFQGMKITIDENGEVTMESSKSTIGFNGEKIKRQMAAAATQSDMKAVLALLEQDIKELEDGLKNNMCDEAEVEKAKKLLEQAKEKMARLPDRAPTPAEQSMMSVNMLI